MCWVHGDHAFDKVAPMPGVSPPDDDTAAVLIGQDGRGWTYEVGPRAALNPQRPSAATPSRP